MSDFLSSFDHDINAAVIGASGGIGSAFMDHLQNHPKVQKIFALSRSGKVAHAGNAEHISCDITDEDSIKNAAAHIKQQGELDLILVATGLLHGDDLQPEKSLRDLSLENFERVFAINTFGPALVAKHLLPLLPRDRRSIFAAISARVSSIDDNRLGGWHAYRSSKTALNMLLKNFAIETQRRHKHAIIAGLHPGTVDTGLSEPFQGNVPDGKLFTPAHASEQMLQVLNGLTPQDSGSVFAWDGKKIPA